MEHQTHGERETIYHILLLKYAWMSYVSNESEKELYFNLAYSSSFFLQLYTNKKIKTHSRVGGFVDSSFGGFNGNELLKRLDAI